MDDAEPVQGPHIVFVHGGGVGPWIWRAQREYFGDTHRVHAVSLPGHDPHQRGTYTTHRQAAHSIAQRIGLGELEGEVSVVGFSAGGQVAVELAAAFAQQVTRTVVVSSLVRPWPLASGLATVSGWAAPLARHKSFARVQARQLGIPAEDFPAYFALSQVMSKQSLTGLMHANFSFRPPMEWVDSPRPVLLVAGSREPRKLLQDMEQLGGRLHDSRLEVLTGAGHGIPLTHPQWLNDLLASWLSSN